MVGKTRSARCEMPRSEAGERGTPKGGARLSRRRLCFCWSFYDTQYDIRGV